MRIWPGKKRKAKTSKTKTMPQVNSAPKESVSNEHMKLGIDDLEALNNSVLAQIRSIPSGEIARRVDAVSLPKVSSIDEYRAASNILRKEGILIVRDFLDSDTLELAETASDIVKSAIYKVDADNAYEDETMIVQSSIKKVSGYSAMADHEKSIVSVRGGADAGMVDVFNFDQLIVGEHHTFRNAFTQEWLLRLIAEKQANVAAENLNLYLNRGIKKTRGFHADSYNPSLKGFVYLSDVRELDDGPYCYVRRSHNDGPWRQANQKISELTEAKTEAPFVDMAMVVPVLAPRGSFVLSDQAGFHRGIPQAPDAERRVLVMRYK